MKHLIPWALAVVVALCYGWAAVKLSDDCPAPVGIRRLTT